MQLSLNQISAQTEPRDHKSTCVLDVSPSEAVLVSLQTQCIRPSLGSLSLFLSQIPTILHISSKSGSPLRHLHCPLLSLSGIRSFLSCPCPFRTCQPQMVPLWHTDYFERKALEKPRMEEALSVLLFPT